MANAPSYGLPQTMMDGMTANPPSAGDPVARLSDVGAGGIYPDGELLDQPFRLAEGDDISWTKSVNGASSALTIFPTASRGYCTIVSGPASGRYTKWMNNCGMDSGVTLAKCLMFFYIKTDTTDSYIQYFLGLHSGSIGTDLEDSDHVGLLRENISTTNPLWYQSMGNGTNKQKDLVQTGVLSADWVWMYYEYAGASSILKTWINKPFTDTPDGDDVYMYPPNSTVYPGLIALSKSTGTYSLSVSQMKFWLPYGDSSPF